MTTPSRRSSIRTIAVATGLLLTTVFATSATTATTLIPAVDTGGPGGGGGAAVVTAPYAGSANQRSVALIESRESKILAVAYEPPTAARPGVHIF